MPTSWMLSIEGQVVVGPHQNIVAGMAVFFSCYYVFNLVYQEEAACTLEFIQRCFIRDQPNFWHKDDKVDHSKWEGAREQCYNSVSPHVSALLKRLMDYEWL
ncbi:hypothetical protein L3Q82_020912 [Scortum barcoo]|uniref:Uncharacterized protein n=1 Tax=Scortum barcoo TaxID=214431 RepID=A0ACB8V9F5_9TELE|nr:hypothetical protein L3Q82_020912 [Scortum barcoo]